MLTEICAYLRNWFDRQRIFGDFVITGGQIRNADGTALPLLTNQYFRVIGSVFSDGGHKNPTTLTDEEFTGAVWAMAVPPDFLALCEEIAAWVTANAAAVTSPYQSESFANYSYSLRSAGGGSDDGGIGWASVFADRLAPWRKI